MELIALNNSFHGEAVVVEASHLNPLNGWLVALNAQLHNCHYKVVTFGPNRKEDHNLHSLGHSVETKLLLK